ncbi:PAS domain-containing protein [Lysobacter sp. Hz 25]|uniref:PAS domain-containing protein n=1 Tax=Lysobacter sp. Hz 25 TaxID=3383698 RepID=UPI0038D38D93
MGKDWARRGAWAAVIGFLPLAVSAGVSMQGAVRAADAAATACKAAPAAVPDARSCALRFKLGSAGGEAVLATLYERSVEAQHRGDFAGASAALDCAQALAGPEASASVRYELTRRRGVLDYRRECTVEALSQFRQALQLARHNEDRAAQSKAWNNIGSALRRLGDYRGALQALLSSLELQRGLAKSESKSEAGPVLNNIADLYRDLGESDSAVRHYEQARAEFLRASNGTEAAHVALSMGVLALDSGDNARGEALLQQARSELDQAGERTYILRAYAELGRAALARGELAAARAATGRGLAIAAQDGAAAPAPLQLQAARAERLLGQPRAAQQRISAALRSLPAQDSDRPALLAELADDYEALGEWPRAMAALRESETAARTLREARYDREMKWMQVRFETAERDRTIAALAAENQVRALSLKQRTLALWLTAVSAVAAVLGLLVFFLRRQQRARLAEAARQARLAEEVEYYRRAAAELGVDRTRLQAALDSRDDAVLILDAGGQVLAANRSAGQLLGQAGDSLPGRAFGELLGESDASRFAQAMERLDESSASQRLDFGLSGGALRAQLSETGQGEGLIVLGLDALGVGQVERVGLEPVGIDAGAVEALADVEAASALDATANEAMRSSFRRALVELMLAVVEAWERSTGQGRLELAEKSRIWRVTVDDGRLRARAMERYLSLSKLPRQPRWRDVLRSGYYVLAECPLEESVRSELQKHVDTVLTYTRRHALV